MKYKTDLEMILKAILQKTEPLVSEVRISDDGVLAVIKIGEKYMPRRLSPLGKRFLRSGSEVVLTKGESFLEPE
jgi:hypothetical protein